MLSGSHTNHLAGFMKTIGGGIYFLYPLKNHRIRFCSIHCFRFFPDSVFFYFLVLIFLMLKFVEVCCIITVSILFRSFTLIRKSFIILLTALLLLSFSSCSGENEGNMSEKTIAVEINSNSYLAAKTIADEVKEIKTISTEDGAVALVESKEADFVVLDEFKSNEYIESKRKIEVVKSLDFTMDYCAYLHNNQELLNKFNTEIIALLQDGTIKAIKDSYKTGETFYPELQKLKENAPVLTVATDVVGFPYTDLTSNGAIAGIDIDILTIVANKLGYNLELIVVPTDEAFSLLQKDEVDMVISGLIYEAERDADYDASISYLSVEYYLHSRG